MRSRPRIQRAAAASLLVGAVLAGLASRTLWPDDRQ